MLRLIRDFFFPSPYDFSKRRTPRTESSSVGTTPVAPSAGSQPASRQA